MTLDYAPARTPTLEPAQLALVAALTADLADALALVASRAAAYGGPVVELKQPALITIAAPGAYEMIQRWPTVTVTPEAVAIDDAYNVPGAGQWSGRINVDAYLMNSDIAALSLQVQRYADALWAVIVNAGEDGSLAGAVIDYGSVEYQYAPPGGQNATARAVRVGFDVRYRT